MQNTSPIRTLVTLHLPSSLPDDYLLCMSQILIYQTDPSNNISPFIHFPSSFPIYSHTNINWSFLLYSYLCHNAMVPQKSIFIFHCISLTATLPLILWLYACYLYIYKNIRQFFTGYRRFKIIELCVNSRINSTILRICAK